MSWTLNSPPPPPPLPPRENENQTKPQMTNIGQSGNKNLWEFWPAGSWWCRQRWLLEYMTVSCSKKNLILLKFFSFQTNFVCACVLSFLLQLSCKLLLHEVLVDTKINAVDAVFCCCWAVNFCIFAFQSLKMCTLELNCWYSSLWWLWKWAKKKEKKRRRKNKAYK